MTVQSQTLGPAPPAERRTTFLRLFAAAKRAIANRERRHRNRKEYATLWHLSDAQLRDIGLTRADVYALLQGRLDEPQGYR